MPTGYLVGAFDVIGVRDLDVIKQLRETGRSVVVGVFTDEDIVRMGGREPLIPLHERIELVRHVRGVDASIAHDGSVSFPREGWTTFAIADDPIPSGAETPRLLTPRCDSRSGVLRHAVVDSIGRAVA